MERDRRGSRREEHTVQQELRRRRRQKKRLIVSLVMAVLVFAGGFGAGWYIRGTTIKEPVDLSALRAPSWIDQQFLTINQYSRPGTKLKEVNNIVIHYVANEGTSAQRNRDFFEGLKNQSGSNTRSASSHFIIGIDGEIIQCVPMDEISYTSNHRNSDTVSIELCHPDESGEFTEETYESLVKLTAWLCGELKLSSKDVIRHYDITEKLCPKYFVENEDAWEQLKKDIKKAMR